MPRYRYQAVDAQGRPVSREVEAAGPEEALAALRADGLPLSAADLEEITGCKQGPDADRVPAGRPLATAQAVELAGHVAEVTKAGLPLGPGLRAMADELRGRRFSVFLRSVARQTDEGVPLETAVRSLGDRFPAHVRGVIIAGAESGRLAEVLEKFVAIHRERAELGWRIRIGLAYPGLLMGGLLALFLFFSLAIVPSFARIYDDFQADLPPVTVACIWMGTSGARMAVVVLVVLAVGAIPLLLFQKPAWLERLLYGVPILGPIWRWQGLVEFSKLMEILLAQQVPLAEALRLTADGLRATSLAAACRQSATRIEAGDRWPDCLAQSWAFPPSLKPFVESSINSPRPAEAFAAAAEVFRRRISLDITLWEIVVPPAILVAVGFFIGFMVLSLFVPLIKVMYWFT